MHTWDLFVDRKKNIEIIQEFCADGNLADFISRGNIDEKEISLYAWQLMRGMDFLGDLGIAHRKHCLGRQTPFTIERLTQLSSVAYQVTFSLEMWF